MKAKLKTEKNYKFAGCFNFYLLHIKLIKLAEQNSPILPNQELSVAKSELQGETVSVCSSYKRGGQPLYKCAVRSMQICLLVHIYK